MGIYHFIAIGGIGMSGLAKYLLEDGHTVSGSDIADSKYLLYLSYILIELTKKQLNAFFIDFYCFLN